MSDYLHRLCDINFVKAILAGCVTAIIAVFGEDHTAVLVAMGLFCLDTITGTWLACREGRCSSRGFYPAIEKAFILIVIFASTALMAQLYEEFRVLLYVLPTLAAINEFGSILENVQKIRPNQVTGFLLERFGMMKDGIVNTFFNLKQ